MKTLIRVLALVSMASFSTVAFAQGAAKPADKPTEKAATPKADDKAKPAAEDKGAAKADDKAAAPADEKPAPKKHIGKTKKPAADKPAAAPAK
jgi:hypothetical protein